MKTLGTIMAVLFSLGAVSSFATEEATKIETPARKAAVEKCTKEVGTTDKKKFDECVAKNEKTSTEKKVETATTPAQQ